MGTLSFNEEDFYKANQELSKTAFRVWCHLYNNNNYDLKQIAKNYNIALRTCQEGAQELRKKGYLIDNQLVISEEKIGSEELQQELQDIYDKYQAAHKEQKNRRSIPEYKIISR